MRRIKLIAILLIFQLKIDAQSWSNLGNGTSGTPDGIVLASANYKGEIYAGGNFTTAGDIAAGHIAKWDGTGWQPLLTGTNGPVRAMAVYNNELYVAGNFTVAGGVATYNIAKWNGVSWDSVGSEFHSGAISALTADTVNNILYAGGTFGVLAGDPGNNIAKWNGSAWSSVGIGVNSTIRALAMFQGNLYAGGYFTQAGSVSVQYVAKWNGTSWSSTYSGFDSWVYALTEYNSELYAGGDFSFASGAYAFSIAKCAGGSWAPVGGGMATPGGPRTVYALKVFGSDLYAGGQFKSSGGILTNGISKWNGISWSPLGSGINGASLFPAVTTIASDSSGIYIGGGFANTGTTVVNNIAKWTTVAGINENEKIHSFSVFPNPFSDKATIKLDEHLINSQLILTDELGIEKRNITFSGHQFLLEKEELIAGIYFLKIVSGNKIMVRKIIIIE